MADKGYDFSENRKVLSIYETQKPYRVQITEEPKADGTRESRKQGCQQGALRSGKDIRLDAQVVRGRHCKVCGDGQDARTAHHGGYRIQFVQNTWDYYVQLHKIRRNIGKGSPVKLHFPPIYVF